MARNLPWEQQTNLGEGEKAYSYFCHYRDAGPSRSLSATSLELWPKNPDAPRKSSLTTAAWRIYKKYKWKERAAAWDGELDRIHRQSQVKKVKEMNEFHASEAMELQRIALQRLKSMDPKELKASDVLNFLATAIKIERTARGLAEHTERVEHIAVSDPSDGLETEQAPDQIAAILAIFAEAGVVPPGYRSALAIEDSIEVEFEKSIASEDQPRAVVGSPSSEDDEVYSADTDA